MEKYTNYLKSLIPYVAEAFTHVYGEEFKDVINQKLNNAIMFPYYDIEGLNDYLFSIMSCKRCEYSIEFLERIGMDIKEYKKDNYSELLDPKIDNILSNYIFSSFKVFEPDADYWAPIRAFKENNNFDHRHLLKNKIKIINYLLGEEHQKITEENFEIFTKTEKYQKILKKIDECNVIYEELLVKYRNWKEKLKPYMDFVKFEQDRQSEILLKYKLSLTEGVFNYLPISIKNALSGKTLEEKSEVIIGAEDIGSVSYIEFFGYVQMEKLRSKDTELCEKESIIYFQSQYLKKLGIKFPNEKILLCSSEEDVEEYLDFISQDNIIKYIPVDHFINYIKSMRKQKYEDALDEYYLSRNDFIDATKKIKDNNLDFNCVYNYMKNKYVCVTKKDMTSNDEEFASMMFYTIRNSDCGFLFYIFMHECGHIVDNSFDGCGFETDYGFSGYRMYNIYDSSFRKYEKFNEAINDIFTIEAYEYLNDKGMYFIEPQEFTLLCRKYENTFNFIIELLMPLIDRFREHVIRAKINANPTELTEYIGEKNFEQLVNLINKVDYLSSNGLASKINDSPDDEIVKEYFMQVERAKEIYSNIDTYYNNMKNTIVTVNSEVKTVR